MVILCRFETQLPPVPTLPVADENSINMEATKCNQSMSGQNKPRIYKFFTTGVPHNDPATKKPVKKRAATTTSTDKAAKPMFKYKLDLQVVQYILLVVDVFVIAYRITRTYVTIIGFVRGFEDVLPTETVGSSEIEMTGRYRRTEEGQLEMQSMDNYQIKDMSAGTLTSKQDKDPPSPYHESTDDTTLDSKKSFIGNLPSENKIESLAATPEMDSQQQTPAEVEIIPPAPHKLTGCMKVWNKLFYSLNLPKVLLLCLAGVIVYIVITITDHYITVDSVAERGGLDMFTGGLDTRLNSTNWYILKQAKHLNDVTMATYRQHMNFELHALSQMLENFNHEQVSLILFYV